MVNTPKNDGFQRAITSITYNFLDKKSKAIGLRGNLR